MLHRKNRSRKKFLSTPSARRATNIPAGAYQNGEFLSTPSARRATKLWGRSCRFHLISIHALREESDLLHLFIQPSRPLFLSTPSARRATPLLTLPCIWCYISIHALREESDVLFGLPVPCCSANFYPRPPRGERRAVRTACALLFCKFLSTPSARRATMVWERLTAPDRYFYPRPPRGERRCGLAKSALPRVISIHALREESDAPRSAPSTLRTVFLSTPSARRATLISLSIVMAAEIFLSTPSARRATVAEALFPEDLKISIHALREESDSDPNGGKGKACKFLSTPSARRATDPSDLYIKHGRISIHALREESDASLAVLLDIRPHFYPRPPRGERRLDFNGEGRQDVFLSTPSARRATTVASSRWSTHRDFYPRPPRGERHIFRRCLLT